MISVAIVDDHPVYRQGLAMVVDSADDLELVAKARSIEEFYWLPTADVVLLDLHLPGIEGSAGRRPCLPALGYPVLVLSAAGAPDDVVDAIGAGAAGYLTKDSDADEIARCRPCRGGWPDVRVPRTRPLTCFACGQVESGALFVDPA